MFSLRGSIVGVGYCYYLNLCILYSFSSYCHTFNISHLFPLAFYNTHFLQLPSFAMSSSLASFLPFFFSSLAINFAKRSSSLASRFSSCKMKFINNKREERKMITFCYSSGNESYERKLHSNYLLESSNFNS